MCGTVADIGKANLKIEDPSRDWGVMRVEMLSIRNVSKWGFEMAGSGHVWDLGGMVVELAKHVNPKRPIAEPRGV